MGATLNRAAGEKISIRRSPLNLNLHNKRKPALWKCGERAALAEINLKRTVWKWNK